MTKPKALYRNELYRKVIDLGDTEAIVTISVKRDPDKANYLNFAVTTPVLDVNFGMYAEEAAEVRDALIEAVKLAERKETS